MGALNTWVLVAELVMALWAAGEWLRTLGQRQQLDPFGWVLATLAVVFFCAATLVRLAPIVAGRPLLPAPAVSELLVAGWGIMCALSSGRLAYRQSNHKLRFWLDAIMVTTALLAVGWSLLLAPIVDRSSGTRYSGDSQLMLAGVFDHRIGDLVMIAGLILLCSRLPALRSRSMVLMLASQTAIVVGDVTEGLVNRGDPRALPPIAVELCWTLALVLYAVNARRLRAVLLLSAEPVPPITDARPVGRVGLVLPYLPLVGILAFAGIRAKLHTTWGPAETWLAIVASLVVSVRQLLVLLDNRRLLVAVSERELRLQHQAFHDPLTGLPNRLLFGQRLQAATSLLPGEGTLSLLFCDLDDFKRVNDHLGHAAGDRLLAIAAERLLACAPEGASVARLGGDEFALLHTGDPHGESSAQVVAARIMATFQEPIDLDGEPLLVVVSIGIGHVRAGEVSTAEELLTRADLAMLAAKKQGKGRFATFDPAMKPADLHDRTLVNEFAVALRGGELYPAYQPIVDLATGHIIGLEALARWDHPTLGPVPPDQFIALAESTGLIGAVTRHMLQAVAADHEHWRKVGLRLPYVSVNIAPSLLCREDFRLAIEAVIAGGLPAENLVLEVTDTDTVSDHPAVGRTLNELRHRGVRVALDDFGAGFHTLTNLRLLPIDMIKIDRSILAGAAASARDDTLMAAYVDLGRRLGIAVVAVGVEDALASQRLLELGCPAAQGFLFSRPLTGADVAGRLANDALYAPVTGVPSPRPSTVGINTSRH